MLHGSGGNLAFFEQQPGCRFPVQSKLFNIEQQTPSTAGRDRAGTLVVPTISLYALVPGLRARAKDARARLIDYLVSNFDELVYV